MPRNERPWFRTYTEMPRDRKLRRERPETRWLWVTLMCMAGASPERGSLYVGASPATVDDIADEAALPPAKVRAGLGALEAAGMIEKHGGVWHLRNWDARQFESDRSTERVRAFRQRQGNVTTAVAVTPPDTESETDLHHQPCSEPPAVVAVDDDEDRSAGQPLDPVAVKVRAVVDRCATARMDGKTIANRDAYERTVRVEFAGRELELRDVIASHPSAPVSTLAGWMLGEPNSLHTYRDLREAAS